ncbi:hydrolase 2, exosortase A system-associated [Massilia sp. PWRC2]|uniref:hydrolase 2, exosortase A system-associated n=1 Tax=Massilia sp. PWRC2 TaxID=2804626 RepID=UPI003CFA432A
MALSTAAPAPQALFLQTVPDQRFCLFYAPAGTPRAALLYIAPFGEEMNKSRRMAALQARALAASGFGVLLLDLYGCGDSSGDFADARWNIWLDDIAAARRWLQQHCPAPQVLWGLRLGALLALAHASTSSSDSAPAALLLWQPVTSGATFLNQFLRLRVANDMMSSEQPNSGGTKALRDTLKSGQLLEVAGYDLAPALADALEANEATGLAFRHGPVHWFETAATAGRPTPPAALKVSAAWQAGAVALTMHSVLAPSFWASQEIAEAPALLDATQSVLNGMFP